MLEEAKDALTSAQSGLYGAHDYVQPDRASEAVALCRSAIERYTPEDSPYRRQVVVLTKQGVNIAVGSDTTGLLSALIKDFEKGRLRTFEEVIHADVSGDYMTQAETLLKGGYKDAAMVVGGTVLEQHLRLIASRNGVGLYTGGRYKKGEQLNADLSKAGVYGKTEQKMVTAWLGRRNDAAHGDYDAYDHRDVGHALDGIQAFVARFPA